MSVITFLDQTPPDDTPWGRPQQVDRIAAGIYSLSTASHGGFWITQQRRDAMPPCDTFAGGNWFEEDSDWHLVALAFPDEFSEKELEAARRTADVNTRIAARDLWNAQNPSHINMAMNVKPDEFLPAHAALAEGQAELGSITLVSWGADPFKGIKAGVAIVRGYSDAQQRLARQPLISECIETPLQPTMLNKHTWAWTVARRGLESVRA